MNLEENFIEYRNITLNIIEMVKIEETEKLDEFFEQRQLILDNINRLSYSKEELRQLYIKLGLDKLDKTLEEEMKNKKEEFLNKIKENQKRKIAMNGYNNIQAKAVFLTKKL